MAKSTRFSDLRLKSMSVTYSNLASNRGTMDIEVGTHDSTVLEAAEQGGLYVDDESGIIGIALPSAGIPENVYDDLLEYARSYLSQLLPPS